MSEVYCYPCLGCSDLAKAMGYVMLGPTTNYNHRGAMTPSLRVRATAHSGKSVNEATESFTSL